MIKYILADFLSREVIFPRWKLAYEMAAVLCLGAFTVAYNVWGNKK